jgi:hypothetical protein
VLLIGATQRAEHPRLGGLSLVAEEDSGELDVTLGRPEVGVACAGLERARRDARGGRVRDRRMPAVVEGSDLALDLGLRERGPKRLGVALVLERASRLQVTEDAIGVGVVGRARPMLEQRLGDDRPDRDRPRRGGALRRLGAVADEGTTSPRELGLVARRSASAPAAECPGSCGPEAAPAAPIGTGSAVTAQ